MPARLLYRYIAIVLIAVPVVFNLLRPGFFVTDDGDWMIIRFSAFYQELSGGQVPVRWLTRLNNSYGYPVATFLYPGFMYLASAAKIIGMGYVTSVKLVMIGSVLVGTFFTKRWIRITMSPYASYFGAILYAYHPYLAWDIYTRGSVGEILALGIMPLALYAASSRKTLLLSISYAALIVSHNTLSLLFVPVTFLMHALALRLKSLLTVFGVLFLGMGISAFFWIPALVELPLTVFASTIVSNWQSYFIGKGVGVASHGYGMGAYGLLGPIHVGLALFCSLYLVLGKIYIRRDLLAALSLFLLSACLSLPISRFIWESLPLGTYVQFPFRFISLSVVLVPIVGASIFDQIVPSTKAKMFVLAGSAIALLSVLFPYLVPQAFTYHEDTYYSTNEATTTVQGEYMPRWVRSVRSERAVEEFKRISDDTVEVNTIYWPGYSAYVNGERVPISYENEYGLMRVVSYSDEDDIQIVFQETSKRLIADAVSIVSIVILGIVAVRTRMYASRT